VERQGHPLRTTGGRLMGRVTPPKTSRSKVRVSRHLASLPPLPAGPRPSSGPGTCPTALSDVSSAARGAGDGRARSGGKRGVAGAGAGKSHTHPPDVTPHRSTQTTITPADARVAVGARTRDISTSTRSTSTAAAAHRRRDDRARLGPHPRSSPGEGRVTHPKPGVRGGPPENNRGRDLTEYDVESDRAVVDDRA
jgi:hypothetical protein